MRRGIAGLLTLVAALAIAATAAGSAPASVGVYDEDGQLAKFKKAKCSVKGKKGNKSFVAYAEAANGWDLDVYVARDFWGGFKSKYKLFWGDFDVGFDVFGADGTLYSNQFPFPGPNPPGAGGELRFRRDGKKLGLGFIAAWTRNYSTGVAVAGGLKCKYRKRR